MEPGQALSGGRRSMADTQGWFSRGEVIPESDPGPQGRVGLCLGSSRSSPEVSFQVRPPGVPSRRVLQACPPGASSRCALQVCPPGMPSRCPSRHTLQVCPPGVSSRCLPPGASSRCALQACPPGVPSRCPLQASPPGVPPRNPAHGHSPTKDATTERQHSHFSQVLGQRAAGRSRWRTRWGLQGAALTWTDRMSLQAA